MFDVDQLYEDRLAISDLDIEGYNDGDDPGYGSLPDDIIPDTIVTCDVCQREVEWGNSQGYTTEDVFCLTCWDKELKKGQRHG